MSPLLTLLLGIAIGLLIARAFSSRKIQKIFIQKPSEQEKRAVQVKISRIAIKAPCRKK